VRPVGKKRCPQFSGKPLISMIVKCTFSFWTGRLDDVIIITPMIIRFVRGAENTTINKTNPKTVDARCYGKDERPAAAVLKTYSSVPLVFLEFVASRKTHRECVFKSKFTQAQTEPERRTRVHTILISKQTNIHTTHTHSLASNVIIKYKIYIIIIIV